MKTDIVIVGTGAAGLFAALNLPKEKNIIIITKDEAKNSDSFLAQGGMCVLKSEDDYDNYFEDTMKAGHYENDKRSVDIMIRSSVDILKDLEKYNVDFAKEGNNYIYTREGAHSSKRILFHEDTTGKEITSKLLLEAEKRDNITIMEHVMMVDIISKDNVCYGIVARNEENEVFLINADYTIFACGGIGGLYDNSTNFPHITADAIAIAINRGIELKNIDYIQIHPTTLYSKKKGRRFLISESVRGEGAILLNKNMERFANELLPRDLLTKEILKQMKKDNMPYVWLSMKPIDEKVIKHHFPNIYKHCLEEGYDVTKEPIPVVPSQHYFMGGIKVDYSSKTSMEHLYAVGETSCNGVHGKNRLASNSLLESLVFAKRAAKEITDKDEKLNKIDININLDEYKDYTSLKEKYKKEVLKEVERNKEEHERAN
ncbi:L-aspartate oxidase [Anaerofustis stercorihominis]|uniref:L-aspartate oxidase n=1 Tax=Anaerofustis stercorihominis TaxID=214853 RepID=UPI001106F38B|nr:L-aspartate oxidase [Anaerofustis stercorihominis]